MESLFPFFLAYSLAVGLHFILKFEQELTSKKLQMKFFHALFRITDIVVAALCFLLPIIMLLNGAEAITIHNTQGGVILIIASILLLFCSYLLFVRAKHRAPPQ